VVKVAFDGDDETPGVPARLREDAGAATEVYSPQSRWARRSTARMIGETSQYELPKREDHGGQLLSANPYSA